MEVRTPSSRPRSLILCALDIEFRAVAGSSLCRDNVIICTGPGYDAVVAGLEAIAVRLLDEWSVGVDKPPLIFAGLGGALHGDLEVGSAWVGRSVTNEGGKTISTSWPTTDQRGAVGLRMVDVLGSDAVLDTVSAKAEARSRFGVDLVDTESHALADWACEAGYPFGVVRGVSDSFDGALPMNVSGWTRADGSTNVNRVFRDLALHPWWIGSVRELARNSHAALENVIATLEMLGLADDVGNGAE